MEEIKTCYLHKETAAHLFCQECRKPLCNACARFSFGRIYCESCAAVSSNKTRSFSSDPIRYQKTTVKKTDYSNLYIKYALRIFILLVFIIIIINRDPILAFAVKSMPKTNQVPILSGLTNTIGKVIPAANTEGVRKLTSQIAGSLVHLQMGQFVGPLELGYQMDKVYPRDFSEFLKSNFESADKTKDPSKDIWGTAYRLEIKSDGFVISSAGIDKVFDNEDDIKYTYKRKRDIPF